MWPDEEDDSDAAEQYERSQGGERSPSWSERCALIVIR